MTKMIETTVLKPHMHIDGRIVQVGATISVDETRHRALMKKGYVPRDGDAGDDPAPERTDGITNADFKPRRTKVTGGKPAKSSAGDEPANEPASPIPGQTSKGD